MGMADTFKRWILARRRMPRDRWWISDNWTKEVDVHERVVCIEMVGNSHRSKGVYSYDGVD